MKNIRFLLAVVVLLSTLGGCGMTHVTDSERELYRTGKTKAEPAAANGDLKVTLDATYKSRNIWRGFDWYSRNHSAIQPSIDIDFWGTGFGTNILWSRAVHSGFENKQWLVYSPYSRNSMGGFPGRVFAPQVSSPITRLLGYGRTKAADAKMGVPNHTGEHTAAGFIPWGSKRTGI